MNLEKMNLEKMNLEQKKSAGVWNFLMLGMIVVFYACVNFQRSSVPGAIFNELQTSFDASAAAVASLSAAFMYVYAATQLIAGPLSDKFGGTRTILGGGALFLIGCLLFPAGQSFGMVFLSRILLGLGAGVIYLSMVKELDRLFPKKFSLALGTALLLGYSGSMFGGFPLVAAVKAFNWRNCFWAVAGLALISYLLIWFFRSRVTLPPVRQGRLPMGSLLIAVKTRTGRRVLAASGLSFGLYYMMLTVAGKKFLEDFAGVSSGAASTVLTVMVAISAGGNFACGILTTLCGNRRKPFLLFGLAMPLIGALMGLIGIWLHLGAAWFITAMICFAFGAAISPATTSLMREVNPPESTGAVVCALNFLAYVSVALYANLVGLFMDWFSFGNVVRTESSVLYPASSYMSIFVLALVVAAGTLTAGILSPETKGENVYGKVK